MNDKTLGEYLNRRYPEAIDDVERLRMQLTKEHHARQRAQLYIVELQDRLNRADAEAARAVAREREACACIADALEHPHTIALAIRSRSQP